MFKAQGNATNCALFFISVQSGIRSSTQGSMYCGMDYISYFHFHHGYMMFKTQGNAKSAHLFFSFFPFPFLHDIQTPKITKPRMYLSPNKPSRCYNRSREEWNIYKMRNNAWSRIKRYRGVLFKARPVLHVARALNWLHRSSEASKYGVNEWLLCRYSIISSWTIQASLCKVRERVDTTTRRKCIGEICS
jgi:hypothetical protein